MTREDEMLQVIRNQGVHIDVIAVADELAEACPQWAPFLANLKRRAEYNKMLADKVLATN